MATDAGEIQVTLSTISADFKKGIAEAKSKIDEFGKKNESVFTAHNLLLATAATAVFKYAKDSIAAYGQQELATARLEQALRNQGFAVTENVARYSALANSLQDLTGADDTAIMSAQALLTTFGIEGDMMEKVTRASVDLAAAKGIDLASASQLLGKAFVGETGALSRYGIVIDDNIPKTEKFAAVMQQMGRFTGSAEAQGKTFAGQLTIMGQAFGDLQKVLGEMLASGGAQFVVWITSGLRALTSFGQSLVATVNALGGWGAVFQRITLGVISDFISAITAAATQLTYMFGIIPGFGAAMESLRTKIALVNSEIQKRIELTDKEVVLDAVAAMAAQKAEQAKLNAVQQSGKSQLDARAAMAAWIEAQRLKDRDETIKDYEEKDSLLKDWEDSFITTNKEMSDAGISIANQVFDNFGNGVADMIMEGKSFAESMKKLWQNMAKAMIAEITKIIAKMLALFALRTALNMPTGGIGGLAATAMAGSQHGGMIGEPSIVTGLRSGKSMLAGEAGPEEIVPVGKNAYFGEGGNRGGGGGSVTINIQGQFIEGNEASWSRLMREKIVPEIRRFTMSTPVGPFTRRRGGS